jgi:anthranilate synthase component 1
MEQTLKVTPNYMTFEALAKKGNVIPVYRELLWDTETPVSTYLKVKDQSFSFLLESAEGGKRWGRYSFIGFNPYLTVSAKDQSVEIREHGTKQTLNNVDNPLKVLREISRRFKPVVVEDLPAFQGGLVGYVNYDLVRKWERLPSVSAQNGDQSECIFMCPGMFIVFDHFTHQVKVVALTFISDGDDLRQKYDSVCQAIEKTLAHLMAPTSNGRNGNGVSLTEFRSNVQKEAFEASVQRAKDYIVAGDAIQVVLSQRFSGEISGDAFALYRNLRSVNPSPYMFYLNYGETKLIGASPEVLVKLTDGKIELRPIAGTRPRGGTRDEDAALEKELMADPKERAEHIMLVDLGRNDVGRVSQPGTVQVPQLMVVERYSHVMHIVSQVEGVMRDDLDSYDLFMSAFPAGTVTGAPKVRAMEIISELEVNQRGPYAGAVGYFGFNGNMDFCITIRTITVHGKDVHIQVGAGIVYDSLPEREYDETLRKGAAMFKAIEKVKENDFTH